MVADYICSGGKKPLVLNYMLVFHMHFSLGLISSLLGEKHYTHSAARKTAVSGIKMACLRPHSYFVGELDSKLSDHTAPIYRWG